MRMHNPAHPGEILKEFMGPMEVTELANHLNIARSTLSRILHGHAGISAPMAIDLSKAFNTSPELWLNMQTNYDLWQASRVRRAAVHAIDFTAVAPKKIERNKLRPKAVASRDTQRAARKRA